MWTQGERYEEILQGIASALFKPRKLSKQLGAMLGAIDDVTSARFAQSRRISSNSCAARMTEPVVEITGYPAPKQIALKQPRKKSFTTMQQGRSRDWIKSKNPNAPAVKREAEEDWGHRRH
jgi:hypothetical protein